MRMIDADSLTDLIEKSSILSAGFKQVFCKLVAGEPTVDVFPVTRCKDCIYAQSAKINKKGFCICPASGMEITDDDFCSYGEKRSEPPVQHRPELEGGIT